jgi:hypothetical protein
MTYFSYAKHIFERLQIKNPMKTLIYNYPFFDKDKFNKMFHNKKITNQYGGGDKNTYITYKNIKYKFTRVDDGDGYLYYALYQSERETNPMCIMIIIEKEINNCAINEISYDDKCFVEKNPEDGKKWSGSDLLKIAFKLIDKIKDKYNLKTVTLTDNSQKTCKNGKNIDLGLMLTLISGDTWYGRYGFLPKDKNLKKEYDSNKKIIKNTKLSDVPYFREMMNNALKKYYKNNKKLEEEIMRTYDEYCKHNKRLKSFLSFLLEYYDATCEMFYDFYISLARKLGIFPMKGVSFIKKL